MTVIETNDDLVVVDCGLMFPDDEMYGVDIVINDFTYVRERAHKLRGLLVTHGHEDHIGGIPYFVREFPQTPIAATALTIALIKAKSREQKLGDVEFTQVKPGSRVLHGSIETEFVHVNHSVAGACALALRTPSERIFHTGRLQVRSDADRRQAGRFFPESRQSAMRASSAWLSIPPMPSARAIHARNVRSAKPSRRSFLTRKAASSWLHLHRTFRASSRPSTTPYASTGRWRSWGRSMRNVVHFATELGYLRVPADTWFAAKTSTDIRPSASW